MRLPSLYSLLALLLALAPAAAAQDCTTTWTNASGGSWDDAGNWSSGVPTTTDRACVLLGGTYTITSDRIDALSLLLGGDAGAQTLVLTGPVTLTESSTLGTNAVVDWQRGYLEAGTLVNEGLIRFTGPNASRGARGTTAVLRNTGTVNWEDSGILYVYNGARFENAGAFNVSGTGSLRGFSGVGTFVTEAGATLTKTGDALWEIFGSLVVENEGTWSVQGGTVELEEASTHTDATLAVAEDARLQFNRPVTIEGTLTSAPAGRLALNAAMTAGAGATLAVTGTGFEWLSGYLEAGRLVNRDLIRFTGGNASRGARGATAVLRNTGTVNWEDSGILYVYNDARFENAGAFNVSGTGSLRGFSGVGTFVTEAGATLTKTGDALWEIFGRLVVENAGTWSVQGGTVELEEASTHTDATLAVAEDARLQFNRRLSIAQTLTANPDGALVLNAPMSALDEVRLRIGGTGLEWISGYLEEGTLVNEGLIRFTGPNASRGARGTTAVLRNTGTVNWEGSGILYVYDDARFENASAFNVSGTGSLRGFSGVGTFVTERGATLTKTGDALWEIFGSLVVENEGTWSVQGGTVELEEASTHTDATLAVAEDARLQFNRPVTIEGTLTSAPAGRLALNAAMTAGAGATLAVTGTGFEWLSGYLEAGRLVNRDLIRFTGGNASRGARGATAVLRNTGTVNWEGSGILYVYDDARFENASTFNVSGTGSLRGFSGVGTFVTEAGATLTKTGDALWEIFGRLVVENAGTWSVQGGTVELEEASTQRNARLNVAADATLQFNRPLIIVGTLTSAPVGALVLNAELRTDRNAALAVTGTGLEWRTGYLTTGTVVNRNLIRLTGDTNNRGVRGGDARLRNTGTMEWRDDGFFYVYNGARFENTATLDVVSNGGLRGFTGLGTFVNSTTATFTRQGDGVFFFGSDIERNRSFEPFDAVLDGVVQFGGEVNAIGLNLTNRAAFAVTGPDGEVGPLTWTGDFVIVDTTTTAFDLAGPDFNGELIVLSRDQADASGTAQLDGALDVVLRDGYVPDVGASFDLITAEAITGGFTDLTSLTIESANRSLYPTITDELFSVTAAEGILTVSGDLIADPAESPNGRVASVALSGTGFAPDLTVTLECVACDNPETAGRVAGQVRTMTTNTMTVLFDLSGDVLGSYEIVLRDPRGGEVRTPFGVSEGPVVLTVETLQGLAQESDGTPGLFLVRTNRTPREPVVVPYTLSGTATLFADYSLDVLGGSLTIPAGIDSVVVHVFPVGDDVSESQEFVTFTATYDNPEPSSLSATIRIEDGPGTGSFDVFASSPSAAGNVGSVTVVVGGQGFDDGTQVVLSAPSGTLAPYATSVDATGTRLEATFALANQEIGLRDVVVTSGSGDERRLLGALDLEVAEYPDVFVQVLAPPRVPRTRERTYSVLLRNRGNVNVLGRPVIAGLPEDAEWSLDPETYTINNGGDRTWRDIAPLYPTEDGEYVIMLPEIMLGPGETRELQIVAAIGTPQELRLIGGWIYDR